MLACRLVMHELYTEEQMISFFYFLNPFLEKKKPQNLFQNQIHNFKPTKIQIFLKGNVKKSDKLGCPRYKTVVPSPRGSCNLIKGIKLVSLVFVSELFIATNLKYF